MIHFWGIQARVCLFLLLIATSCARHSENATLEKPDITAAVATSSIQPGPRNRTLVSGRSSQFVSHSYPTTMNKGSYYEVQVTMLNNGTVPWTTTGPYGGFKLGSMAPNDNNRWGVGRVNLGGTVNPGQQKTFTFTIRAPFVSGGYGFQWGMLEEGVTWFGQPSPVVYPQVTGATSLYAPSGFVNNGIAAGYPSIEANGGVVYGWACDKDQASAATVDFRIDGQYVDSKVANQYHAGGGLTQLGVCLTDYHRFEYKIPNYFCDGKPHTLQAYVGDLQTSQEVLLQRGTVTFNMPLSTCQAPTATWANKYLLPFVIPSTPNFTKCAVQGQDTFCLDGKLNARGDVYTYYNDLWTGSFDMITRGSASGYWGVSLVQDNSVPGAPFEFRCFSTPGQPCFTSSTQYAAQAVPEYATLPVIQPTDLIGSQGYGYPEVHSTRLSPKMILPDGYKNPAYQNFEAFDIWSLNPRDCSTPYRAGTFYHRTYLALVNGIHLGGDLGYQDDVLVLDAVSGVMKFGVMREFGIERYFHVKDWGHSVTRSYSNSKCYECQDPQTCEVRCGKLAQLQLAVPVDYTRKIQSRPPSPQEPYGFDANHKHLDQPFCANGLPRPPSANNARASWGFVDYNISSTNGAVIGWACDPDWSSFSIPVEFQIDGVIIAAIPARAISTDVNGAAWTQCPTGYHRFSYQIGNQYRTGTPHTFKAFATDAINGLRYELFNSSQTFVLY